MDSLRRAQGRKQRWNERWQGQSPHAGHIRTQNTHSHLTRLTHTHRFTLDESVLYKGAAMHVTTAVDFLRAFAVEALEGQEAGQAQESKAPAVAAAGGNGAAEAAAADNDEEEYEEPKDL